MATNRKSGESRVVVASGTGASIGRMSASASTVTSPTVPMSPSPKGTAEQLEAQMMFSAVGEVRKAVTARGALLSACSLAIGLEPLPDDDEGRPLYAEDGSKLDPEIPDAAIEVATEALASLADIRGSQGSLIETTSMNWDITGEAYLCGWWVDSKGKPLEEEAAKADPDARQRWEVFGTSAYRCEGSKHFVVMAERTTEVELPKSAYVVRTWKRHPVYPDQALGWVMSALPTCRSLLAYSLAERSQALSSAVGTIHLVPTEAAPAEPMTEGQEPVDVWASTDDGTTGDVVSPGDRWAAKLDEMIASVIQEVMDDWGSGRAVQGGVLAVEGKFIEMFGQSINVGRPVDAGLGAMTDRALQRLREQADCSPEMISGLGDTNRWNGKQIDESDYRRYHRPQIEAIAEAWTSEVIRPALLAAGFDLAVVRKLRIIVNKSAIVAPPDRAKLAGEALTLGAIGWEGYRQLADIPDRFKPSEEELEAMIEFWQARSTRIESRIGGGSSGGSSAPSETNEVNDAAGSVAIAGATFSVEFGTDLGDILIGIERAAREAVEAAGLVALDAALSRANAKTRNLARKHLRLEAPDGTVDVFGWLGPERTAAVLRGEYDDDAAMDEDLIIAALAGFRRRFDNLGDQFFKRVLKALGITPPTAGTPSVSPHTGVPITVEALSEALEAGWATLTEGAIAWVREAAAGSPTPAPPQSLWRRVVSALGGNRVPTGTAPASPRGGTEATAGVFGPTFRRLEPPATEQVWSHHAVKPNPFPEHMALDGAVVTGPEDPILAGAPWGSYWPGDHHGCMCDVVPVFETNTEGA